MDQLIRGCTFFAAFVGFLPFTILSWRRIRRIDVERASLDSSPELDRLNTEIGYSAWLVALFTIGSIVSGIVALVNLPDGITFLIEGAPAPGAQ